MKILVTGAEGQLGAELVRQLSGQAIGVDLPKFDLTRPESVRKTLLAKRPDVVINTAAYTQVDLAEDQPDICRAVNVDGVRNLVETCDELNCRLVQISTDYVFHGPADRAIPYCEKEAPNPRGVYAVTKYEAEQLLTDPSRHLVVRTCGLYGQGGSRASGNFVRTMLRLGQERPVLRVVDDQRCTPSYTRHVARAVKFLVERQFGGTFHVVNRGATTWCGFAREIFRAAGMNVEVQPITSAEYPLNAPRPFYSVLDTTKYHSLRGAPPMPPWEVALREYLREIKHEFC